MQTLDIHYDGKYPSNVMSTLSPSKFVFRNCQCNSIESVLQAIKFPDRKRQLKIIRLSGKEVLDNRQGLNNWTLKKEINWNGILIDRFFTCGEELNDYIDGFLPKKRETGVFINTDWEIIPDAPPDNIHLMVDMIVRD